MATNKLLIIVTNVGEYDTVGYRTGLWLGELTHFWDVAEEAGYQMDIASPRGGYIPIDPESLAAAVLKEGGAEKRYEDRQFMNVLEETKRVAELSAEPYDAIYLTGGHGVCYDFRKSTELAALIAQFFEAGKVVSAVCHGPAGLLEVRLKEGTHLLEGRKVTGFSWAEEVKVGRDQAVPYNLEEELGKRGAIYEKAWMNFASYVVEDGLLITGQNPSSAAGVAKAVVKALTTT
jgi:putative intracellular protease/amidase